MSLGTLCLPVLDTRLCNRVPELGKRLDGALHGVSDLHLKGSQLP
jgi:hypothetical protein